MSFELINRAPVWRPPNWAIKVIIHCVQQTWYSSHIRVWTFIYVCILFASSKSLGCIVNIQYVTAAEEFYPPWYAEWGRVEQSRAGLISPSAMAARPVVGRWWISVPGYIMVGQGSTGVKDNTLPSLLNQMQIKLKAAEQQIPPLTASLWTSHNPLSIRLSSSLLWPLLLLSSSLLLSFLLIVLATELRERTRGGDGCSEAFTTKII